MSTIWDNGDGLRVEFGKRSQGQNGDTGVRDDNSGTKKLEFTIKYPLTVGTPNGQWGAATPTPKHPKIPADAVVKSVTLKVDDAFTSAGSATLNIGTYTAAGADDDINGLAAAITKAELTAGSVHHFGDGINTNSNAGADIGAVVNASADTYVGAEAGTAVFTAGVARCVVEYIAPHDE